MPLKNIITGQRINPENLRRAKEMRQNTTPRRKEALTALPLSFIEPGITFIWGALRIFYGVDEEVILLGKLTYAWREIE